MLKRSDVKLIWRGDSAMRRIGTEAYERLDALGEDIVSEIKEFISQPGTGKFYKKSKTVWYQASAPGFPPTVKFSELKISISHAVVTEGGVTYLLVGTTKDYGVWLEIGTKFMKARPWLKTILVKMAPDTKNILIRPWKLEKISEVALPKGYTTV